MSAEKFSFYGDAFAYKVAIEEVKFRLTQQFEAIEAAKNTAKQILNSASLILALAGVLQIFSENVLSEYQSLYYSLLGFGGVAYIALILSCILVLLLQKIQLPIKADWETVEMAYLHKQDEVEILRSQLASYLNVIQMNALIVERKSKLANFSGVLLPVLVLLLSVASILPTK